MLADSVIKLRDAMGNAPCRIFYDNNQIVNSDYDEVSWNDELEMVHVIRTSNDPDVDKNKSVEYITFSYEDIRSISFFKTVNTIEEDLAKIKGIGGTAFTPSVAKKIAEKFRYFLKAQNESKY